MTVYIYDNRKRTIGEETAVKLMRPTSCPLSHSGDCEAVYWENSNTWWCPFLDKPCGKLLGPQSSASLPSPSLTEASK